MLLDVHAYMAILQALLTLLSRSAGKILSSIFGWAVRALFGRVSPRETTFLSAIVGAAAAWPILLVGLIAPKIAALLLAFVPIPKLVPSWAIRLVWLGLVVLVPLAVGIAVASKAPPDRPRHSMARRVLSGVPITIGLAAAFVIMFITVPFMRLGTLLTGKASADIPLITESAAYHQMAALAVSVLNRHGFGVRPGKPSWWVAAPLRVLKLFGGDAFGLYVPVRLEHYQSPKVILSFYPSGVLLRGRPSTLPWAHGLICEATARGQGFQTSAPAAQELEKQIKRIWKVYEEDEAAHVHSTRLAGRLSEIARELGTADIDFDDWQVIYRQLLQAERAINGQPQILEEQVEKHPDEAIETTDGRYGVTRAAAVQAPPRSLPPPFPASRKAHDLTTPALVEEIGVEVAHLARKQLELAVTEAKADLKKEASTVAGLSVATIFGLATVNLLLMTVALTLTAWLPGWAGGLIVSGFALIVALAIGVTSWNRRVVDPLARTRRAIKEDVQWSKERLA